MNGNGQPPFDDDGGPASFPEPEPTPPPGHAQPATWIGWRDDEADEAPSESHDEVLLEKTVGGARIGLRGFWDGASFSMPPWLIDGVLPAEGVSMLFAPSGVGKTWVVDDWAVRIAAGKPWLGRPVMSGSVLYIAAEGAFTLPSRTFTAKTNLGIETVLPIFVVNQPVMFNDEATHATVLGDLVRETFAKRKLPPIALVVIDTYTACIQGSANDDDVASAFMRGFRAFLRRLSPLGSMPAAGLIVHHPGLKDTDRARGSSAFHADVDCGMLLEEATPVEELAPGDPQTPPAPRETRTLILRCAKEPRQGLAFPPIPLELRRTVLTDHSGQPIELGDSLMTGLMVHPVDATTVPRLGKLGVREAQRKANEARALAVLNSLVSGESLTSEDWRVRGEITSKAGWEVLRDALVASGKVSVVQPLPGKKRVTYRIIPSRGK